MKYQRSSFDADAAHYLDSMGRGLNMPWLQQRSSDSLDSKLKVLNINITDQIPREFHLRRNSVLFPVVNKHLLNGGEQVHNKMC